MSTGSHPLLHPATASGAGTWARRVLWLAVVALAVRFIVSASLDYVDFSESSYGRWWTVRWWLAGHVTGGTLALAIGPIQFVAAIRRKHLAVHRALGHVYALGILVGSTCGAVLGFTSAAAVHWTWSVGLLSLAFVWFTTMAMGYRAIRLGWRTQHKEWMIRSYVVTFAFVTFRILNRDLFPTPPEQPQLFVTQGPTFVWIAWSLPLFVTEVCLQWRKPR